MTRPVLLDNTVLVNFASVDRPDLILEGPLAGGCTTPAVIAEYEAGVAAGVVPEETWRSLPQVAPTSDESEFARSLSNRFGAGERSCLAVAYFRDGLFVSDDADARDEARRHDIQVTGTLGILVAAVQRGILSRTEGNVLLRAMIDSGYRSPVDRVDPLLD